jgi:hypothetical protein
MGYREKALGVYNAAIQQALEFRRGGQEVTMTFFLVLPNGEKTVLVPAAMLPTTDKDELVGIVRALATRVGARYVIHVSEAWMSAMNTEGDGAPSEQPDRQEVILASVDGPGLRRMTLVPILPNGGGFGEPTVTDSFGGRMTDFTGNADYH